MLVSRDIFSVAGDPDVGLMQCSIFLPTNSNYNDDCVNIANELLFTMIMYEFINGFPKLKNTQGTCHTWGTKPTPRLSSFLPENLVGNSKYLRYAKER